MALSHQMPTYLVGGRRLHVRVWRHGQSLYGWPQGQDGGFAGRHPGLQPLRARSRSALRNATGLSDDDLGGLIRAVMDGVSTRSGHAAAGARQGPSARDSIGGPRLAHQGI
jgi:hypothetical protein